MFGHNIICIQCLNESYKTVSGIYSLLDKNFRHFSIIQVIHLFKVFWYPKLICTSNSRSFKTKHFDINLMKFGGLIRKLWVIKYEIWTAAILFSS